MSAIEISFFFAKHAVIEEEAGNLGTFDSL